jgi:hypothetical protein
MMGAMKVYSWLLVLAACGEVKTPPDAPTPPGGDPTLTVTVAGAGRVTSTPAGIDCPGMCSAPFTAGTQVTLAAATAAPTVFTGWTSGCAPSRRDCVLTVDADAMVAAGFAMQSAKRWLLTAGAQMSFSDGSRGTVATSRWSGRRTCRRWSAGKRRPAACSWRGSTR